MDLRARALEASRRNMEIGCGVRSGDYITTLDDCGGVGERTIPFISITPQPEDQAKYDWHQHLRTIAATVMSMFSPESARALNRIRCSDPEAYLVSNKEIEIASRAISLVSATGVQWWKTE